MTMVQAQAVHNKYREISSLSVILVLDSEGLYWAQIVDAIYIKLTRFKDN